MIIPQGYELFAVVQNVHKDTREDNESDLAVVRVMGGPSKRTTRPDPLPQRPRARTAA